MDTLEGLMIIGGVFMAYFAQEVKEEVRTHYERWMAVDTRPSIATSSCSTHAWAQAAIDAR